MRDKLFKRFCHKTTFFATLLLLLPLFSITGINGQSQKTRGKSPTPEATFTNSAAITIPSSGNATPYPSTITVSGLTGTISTTPGSVKVTLNGFSHTYPDDVSIVLVGPTGAALLLQSGATADDGTGQPASNVTYTISDTGAATLGNDTAITAGTYKPSAFYTGDSFPSPGPGTNYGNPGPAGGGTATFASVFGGTNPNGTWSLYVVDFANGDSGSISGGWTLEITTGGGGTTQPFDNRLDFFGNGLSDYVVVTAPSSGNLIWKATRNDNPTPVSSRMFSFPFGLATDQVTAFGDYTGDGIADVSIYRPGSQGFYWIVRSENSQAFNIPWGTTGDRTNSEGDYDGDGKMDPTVIRTEGTSRHWYILRSGSNTFSSFFFGIADNNDIPLPGADYTGDGADDPAVARLTGTGDILWIIGNTSGALINKVQWGNFNTDYIVPAGDYDGDAKADFVVWRGFGTAPAVNGTWIILKSTGGVSYTQFGIPGTGSTNANRDVPLRSGDYDGDKKTDIAVYRPSNQTFYVLRSSNQQVMTQKAGDPGDIPLAGTGVY